MGTLGLEGVSGNGRRECLLAIASVFGKARVDRWRHKSVSGKIIGDTCSAENNMSNKEIKGKQAESFSSWLHYSRFNPSLGK